MTQSFGSKTKENEGRELITELKEELKISRIGVYKSRISVLFCRMVIGVNC